MKGYTVSGRPISKHDSWIEATVEFINADDECRAFFMAECMDEGATGSAEPPETAVEELQDRDPRECGACGRFSKLFVYFPGHMQVEQVLDLVEKKARQVSGFSPGSSVRILGCQSIEEQDWRSTWIHSLPPDRITERIWIVPPWGNGPLPCGAIKIVLEPGMAFGTGKHITTRQCLEFIEEASRFGNQPTGSFLDVGCGSGILSIAAYKFGAARVVGLDVDPDATRVASKNFSLNGLGKGTYLVNGSLDCCRGRFELIAANLTAPILSQYGSLLGSLLTADGRCILSGILLHELTELLGLYKGMGFQVVGEKEDAEEGWGSVLLKQ